MSDERIRRTYKNEHGEVVRAKRQWRLVCASGCASLIVETRVEIDVGDMPPIYCPVCKQPIPAQVWEPGKNESFWVPDSIDNPPSKPGGK